MYKWWYFLHAQGDLNLRIVRMYLKAHFHLTRPKTQKTGFCAVTNSAGQTYPSCIIRNIPTINRLTIIWTATLEIVPPDVCAQQRLKSVCVSAESYQSHHSPREVTLHPCLSRMRIANILIRLCECAGWSESSLGAHILKYVYRLCGALFYKFEQVHFSTCRDV